MTFTVTDPHTNNQICVTAPDNLPQDDLTNDVLEEIELWLHNRKRIDKISFEMDGDMLILRAIELSRIKRIRRITGYLSEVGNFNDAKQAELTEREIHGM